MSDIGEYQWRVMTASDEHVADVPDQSYADAASRAFDVSHPDDAPHRVEARFVELWEQVQPS